MKYMTSFFPILEPHDLEYFVFSILIGFNICHSNEGKILCNSLLGF